MDKFKGLKGPSIDDLRKGWQEAKNICLSRVDEICKKLQSIKYAQENTTFVDSDDMFADTKWTGTPNWCRD